MRPQRRRSDRRAECACHPRDDPDIGRRAARPTRMAEPPAGDGARRPGKHRLVATIASAGPQVFAPGGACVLVHRIDWVEPQLEGSGAFDPHTSPFPEIVPSSAQRRHPMRRGLTAAPNHRIQCITDPGSVGIFGLLGVSLVISGIRDIEGLECRPLHQEPSVGPRRRLGTKTRRRAFGRNTMPFKAGQATPRCRPKWSTPLGNVFWTRRARWKVWSPLSTGNWWAWPMSSFTTSCSNCNRHATCRISTPRRMRAASALRAN